MEEDAAALPRKKPSQAVLELLVRRINDAEFKYGSLLPSERRLMATYSVGRPAVREALQNLQRMGLVVITHGEGARLVEPTTKSVLKQISVTVRHVVAASQQNLAHLEHARIFFEVGITRLAAGCATQEDIKSLADTIKGMEAYSDHSAFMQNDMAFHRKIAEITGNPTLVAVSEALTQWLSEDHVGEASNAGSNVRALEEHRHIVERIAANDVEGAAAAMLRHCTPAAHLLRSDEGE